MREITLEELLEAGCHFGHQVTRGNPKARDYIFEARDNIHIIDLVKTKEGLDNAIKFIKNIALQNGSLIILGTKRQAQGIIDEEAKRAKAQIGNTGDNKIYFVSHRWVGGTLTNLSEVSKNYKKLKDLSTKLSSDEEKSKYTKKEVGLWQKAKQKLETFYGGIADMQDKPNAIFIVDSHMEHLAIDEARKMGVTTVAITDTNANPEVVDYPIPANDDAAGSIKLIVKAIVDAWVEGRQEGIKKDDKNKKVKEAEDAKIASAAAKAEIKTAVPATPSNPKPMNLKDGVNEKKAEKPKKTPAKKITTKKASKKTSG